MRQILEIGGNTVLVGGNNITFGTNTSILNQFGGVVSVSESPAKSRLSQLFSVVSLTEQIANSNLFQFGLYVSISPGKPRPHYTLNVQSRGPVNLLKDMPVFGRKN